MTLLGRLIRKTRNRFHAVLLYFDVPSEAYVDLRSFERFISIITKVQNMVLITGLQI